MSVPLDNAIISAISISDPTQCLIDFVFLSVKLISEEDLPLEFPTWLGVNLA